MLERVRGLLRRPMGIDEMKPQILGVLDSGADGNPREMEAREILGKIREANRDRQVNYGAFLHAAARLERARQIEGRTLTGLDDKNRATVLNIYRKAPGQNQQ